MTHRHTRVFVVLALALHSLSTAQSQFTPRTQLRELPRQLKCEEGTCTSGEPDDDYDGLLPGGRPLYDCSTQYSNCDVLKKVNRAQYYVITYGERTLDDLVELAKVTSHQHEQVLEAFEVVQGAIREINLQLQVGQNATSQLLVELDTLRGRQAASAALQVAQFFLFIGYLLTLSIIYVVRKCKKHRERLAEEEVELIEQKLQERKARRRAAAAKAKAEPLPNQE